ncbi:MAG: hypothetical protein HRU40_04125 [Saprospiraceae bacterium]|nr:hypothetical protein [Saprospiraceae bacterium]
MRQVHLFFGLLLFLFSQALSPAILEEFIHRFEGKFQLSLAYPLAQ